MNNARKAMALSALFLGTAALASDTAPRFEAGEWEITVSQDGGASYKDSKSAHESGTSSIREERPKQVGKRCFKAKEAILSPDMFGPGCTASDVTYTATTMKAALTCNNPAMTLGGSISMRISDKGKTMSGFQVLSGGGEAVGAVFTTTIEMKHLGKCKGK